jgi:hypothetical protein
MRAAGLEVPAALQKGGQQLALCESIKLLRFEREFTLTVIRNNPFSVSWRDGADTFGSDGPVTDGPVTDGPVTDGRDPIAFGARER